MKIYLAQINPIIGDLESNFKKHLEIIQKTDEHSHRLIIFPELSLIGYPPRDLILKPSFYNEQLSYIKELAKAVDANTGMLLGGLSKNEGPGYPLFNSIYYLHWNKISKVFNKSLLPSYDIFDEKRYFEPCLEVDENTFEFDGKKFGVSICEDIWTEDGQEIYLDNPMERLNAYGAEVFINCSASPFTSKKLEERKNILKRNINRYKRPVIYVNQVGANDHLVFDGNSVVLNHESQIINKAKAFMEDLIEVSYEDLSKPGHLETTLEFTEDEKIEMNLEAIKLGLKDYLAKCGFKKAILGLSGGMDSALVAYIAAYALGKDKLKAIMLPSRFTSEESLKDARELAHNLGLISENNYLEININGLHSEMKTLMPGISALAEENLQARLRANILLAQSNTDNSILLATSNKSELAVGYATIYGDTCGGIAILGDLMKTEVYQMAKYINEKHKEEFPAGIIPENIIHKAPTAELRENQKDQDSLPPYEVLDQIIYHYVEEMMSLKDIINLGFNPELVKRILNLIDRNEYKRQQYPPIVKIQGKTFGYGRKMPIAQGYKHK